MHTDALGEMSLCLENRPLVEGDLSVLGPPDWSSLGLDGL